MLQIPNAVAKDLDLVDAIETEGARPAGMLPRGVVDRVLSDRAAELAELVRAQLVQGIEVSAPEIVLASKTRGRRPVAVLSPWERLTYQVLVRALKEDIPAPDRSSEAYTEFKSDPIEYEPQGAFVVMSDISACYQYIDHGLLETKLVAQTGNGQIPSALREFLGFVMGRGFGLPQNRQASDVLAEVVLGLVDRRLLRRSIPTWRYGDDYRMVTADRRGAHEALEHLDEELRRIGLVINEEKTSVRSMDRYVTWAGEVGARIAEVEAQIGFDFDDFVLFGSEYDDPDEDDEDDEGDEDGEDDGDDGDDEGDSGPDGGEGAGPVGDELRDHQAVALLDDWRRHLEDRGVRARTGSDAVVDRQLVATSLRVLGRTRSADGMQYLRSILDSDPSLTPNVARYLKRMMRTDEDAVDLVIGELLGASELFISGWQAIWLMEPLRLSTGLQNDQTSWLKGCFGASKGFLRASAGDVLAVHGKIPMQDLLGAFDTSPPGSRPKLVSAVARLDGSVEGEGTRSVLEGRPLYLMVAEAALDV